MELKFKHKITPVPPIHEDSPSIAITTTLDFTVEERYYDTLESERMNQFKRMNESVFKRRLFGDIHECLMEIHGEAMKIAVPTKAGEKLLQLIKNLAKRIP